VVPLVDGHSVTIRTVTTSAPSPGYSDSYLREDEYECSCGLLTSDQDEIRSHANLVAPTGPQE
jgi:hypothetical protein